LLDLTDVEINNKVEKMKTYLETITTRYAGTTISIADGELCNFGSKVGNDLYFPNDSLMESIHFAVLNKGDSFNLKTFNNQVFVNNVISTGTQLTHGDFILGGGTLFYFCVEGEKSSVETPLGKLINRLSLIDELYLLIDENTDTRILPLIKESECNVRTLKDGVKNLEGLTANPLLVELNKKNIEKFVRTFWGKGRLVLLELRHNLDESLVHLKHLLSKTQIENGVDLRFYDPRMLRTILGDAEKQHAQFFFAGVERYFVESQLPSYLFEFSWSSKGVSADLIRLSQAATKIPRQSEIEFCLTENNIFGSFTNVAETCLQKLLTDETTDFRLSAEKNLPQIEQFGLKSIAGKIQFVAVNSIINNNLDFEKLFNPNGFSADEKLDFFVERINLNRG
jgi:hypothetical protein